MSSAAICWADVLRFLAALLLAATATTPAAPGPALLPTPPVEHPTEADVPAAAVTGDGCTYTALDATTITARHCLPWNARQLGWNLSGDRAWHGPEPAWAGSTVSAGSTVYGVGYPHATGRTMFALTVLHATVVPVAGRQVPVLMTVGEGAACSSGASGMVGWWTDDTGTARPVGTLAVYSVDPAVTGLPAGQFVCGFAL